MFNDYPDLLTSEQVCDLLKIGKNKLYEILQAKALPCIRIGRRYLIPKLLLIEYIIKSASVTGGAAV